MFGGCGIHGLREKKVQVEVFTEMRFDENMNAIIWSERTGEDWKFRKLSLGGCK